MGMSHSLSQRCKIVQSTRAATACRVHCWIEFRRHQWRWCSTSSRRRRRWCRSSWRWAECRVCWAGTSCRRHRRSDLGMWRIAVWWIWSPLSGRKRWSITAQWTWPKWSNQSGTHQNAYFYTTVVSVELARLVSGTVVVRVTDRRHAAVGQAFDTTLHAEHARYFVDHSLSTAFLPLQLLTYLRNSQKWPKPIATSVIVIWHKHKDALLPPQKISRPNNLDLNLHLDVVMSVL